MRFSPAARLRTVLASLDGNRPRLGVVLVVLSMLFSTAWGWSVVDQSRAALPGDGLYLVKRAVEQAKLAATFNQTDRAAYHLNLVRLRVFEIVSLATKGRYEDIGGAVRGLQAEIDDAAVAFRAVAGQNQDQALVFVEQAQSSLNDGAQLYATLALVSPPGAHQYLRTAIEASLGGIGVLRAQLPDAARMALDLSGPAPTPPAVAAVVLATSTASPLPSASASTQTATSTPTPVTIALPNIMAAPHTDVPVAPPTATAAPALTQPPAPIHGPNPTQTGGGGGGGGHGGGGGGGHKGGHGGGGHGNGGGDGGGGGGDGGGGD